MHSSLPTIHLRQPTLDDSELLWSWTPDEAGERFYTLSYARQSWEKLVASSAAPTQAGAHRIWLIEDPSLADDDCVVAFVDIRSYTHVSQLSLYIAPNKRNMGYGQAILAKAREFLVNIPEEAHELQAEVELTNDACMHAFDKSSAWEEVSRFQNDSWMPFRLKDAA